MERSKGVSKQNKLKNRDEIWNKSYQKLKNDSLREIQEFKEKIQKLQQENQQLQEINLQLQLKYFDPEVE